MSLEPVEFSNNSHAAFNCSALRKSIGHGERRAAFFEPLVEIFC